MADLVTWEAPDDPHPARDAARRSMTAVAEGRKDDWLALFDPDALVQDPVGPSMLDPEGTGHRGAEEITRFWDKNFGAISQFRFRVKDSFANGLSCANVVTITMWLGDGGATMTVDMVAVYTVNEKGQITSLRAHWEPDRAMATITAP